MPALAEPDAGARIEHTPRWFVAQVPMRRGQREKMVENDDSMSIVVLEVTAAWPSWLADYQLLAPNAVVIAQAPSENASAFEARVTGRLNEVAQRGAPVRVAVVVTNCDVSGAHLKMREQITRTMLRVLRHPEEPELVLAAETDDLQTRHGLFALAGALCEAAGGLVNVRVRLSSHQSGLMLSVARSSAQIATPSLAEDGL